MVCSLKVTAPDFECALVRAPVCLHAGGLSADRCTNTKPNEMKASMQLKTLTATSALLLSALLISCSDTSRTESTTGNNASTYGNSTDDENSGTTGSTGSTASDDMNNNTDGTRTNPDGNMTTGTTSNTGTRPGTTSGVEQGSTGTTNSTRSTGSTMSTNNTGSGSTGTTGSGGSTSGTDYRSTGR
jgi:hypothetical protein